MPTVKLWSFWNLYRIDPKGLPILTGWALNILQLCINSEYCLAYSCPSCFAWFQVFHPTHVHLNTHLNSRGWPCIFLELFFWLTCPLQYSAPNFWLLVINTTIRHLAELEKKYFIHLSNPFLFFHSWEWPHFFTLRSSFQIFPQVVLF